MKYHYFEKWLTKIKQSNDIASIELEWQNTHYQIIDPLEKRLINSLIYPLRFIKRVKNEDFFEYLNIANSVENPIKAYELLGEIENITNDPAQINTIKRILLKKVPFSKLSYYSMIKKKGKEIEKTCPHCNHTTIETECTDYVICGYMNIKKGYDNKGCSRDWCFLCNKRLCKQWNNNKLYQQFNRYHNDKCCKIDAYINNLDYYKEYCHCGKNSYVNRYRTSIVM